MRKQTKLVAVLSAAALLAIGASMTSFAAGWTQEDGTWVYLDRDGDRITEEWRKSGSYYYWLDEDGLMATDTLVEDDDNNYYVDANGVRVSNQWVSVENEDGDEVNDRDVDTLWYYMGSSGKAQKAESNYKSYTINGRKYFFDEDGRMASGWFSDEDGEIYYLGDENEGWAYTGWQLLEIDEDFFDDSEYDQEEWFYFQSNGKARRNTRRYIDGSYFAFDVNGVMIDEWISGYPWAAATETNISTANRAFYQEGSGNQAIGWAYKYQENDQGGSEKWYYMESANRGTPFNDNAEKAEGSAAVTKYEDGNRVVSGDSFGENVVAAKVIRSKTYLFNGNGEMLTGVYKLDGAVNRVGGSNLEAGIYYFDKNSGSVEGAMVTGKTAISYDGEYYNYNFRSNGRAYVLEEKDNVLYDGFGVRVEAEEGNSNEVIDVGALIDEVKADYITIDERNVTSGKVIVSSSGRLKKSGTVTIEGTKYKVNDYFVEKEWGKEENEPAEANVDAPIPYEE